MKNVYHENSTRGLADHGWLVSRHTFSFAGYHDPDRMNFGLLRVINDDTVSPSMGFGTHPHENMEIISIPLKGSLRHEDSMGNKHIITAGEVQVMSAGSGITHSEYNNSESENVEFLQIWVLPKERDIKPRYDQMRFNKGERDNLFQLVVAPDTTGAVSIHQNAWFSLADISPGTTLEYSKHVEGNGVYFLVLEGEGSVAGHKVFRRDGLGLVDGGDCAVESFNGLQLLVMEVPMKN